MFQEDATHRYPIAGLSAQSGNAQVVLPRRPGDQQAEVGGLRKTVEGINKASNHFLFQFLGFGPKVIPIYNIFHAIGPTLL